MPKLGQAEDTRPYNKRCRKCGCLVEKVVDQYGWNGKPDRHVYQCANPYHNCGTVGRNGCEPVRKYGQAPAHAYWDGAGGMREHPGSPEDCTSPECGDRKIRHHAGLAPDGEWHPGSYTNCLSKECEPPFERGDVATSGDTSRRDRPWGDWPTPDPRPWVGPLSGDEDE